jgi:hypothetical protein
MSHPARPAEPADPAVSRVAMAMVTKIDAKEIEQTQRAHHGQS